MKKPIYLDYAATTPVDPDVAQAMCGCLTMDGVFANPASRSHIYGWQAEEQVETARGEVADLLSCDSREVVWTSGATESNNLALKGVFEKAGYRGHLITSLAEHKAVIDPAKWLAEKGVEVTWLQPDASGLVALEQVKAALRPDTRLVSLMHVNNETGSVTPVAEIGEFCREVSEGRPHEVLFHVDAAQSVGKLPVDVNQLQVDLLSLSAHKFYGPKGVGALYVRRKIQPLLAPIMHGGGHERGMRSGTLPTHQLVGMGAAARLSRERLTDEMPRIALLRDQLWAGIADLPGVRRNGSADLVSPIHLNVCFSGLDGEALQLSLRELAVSSGSACTSASIEPSYVLKAMGLSDADAHSSIRFSLGRFTSRDDVEMAVVHIRNVVLQLQSG
ncbi:aminotransferase class V-fold PLP-dependent enzyme [Aestuariicella hydrocarbonica]|uniref:cysteine desulfurase n=1 Tax=Pseudomaricurvus hydrocarbonicus TaxID=1470433 RepID=A0A9E5MQ96_9GAMM|nr:aminotransferase class V-fold PLP-dependent enzyme [Aestuariicella hydrocarbonica]